MNLRQSYHPGRGRTKHISQFRATADLTMGGNWLIRIRLRTPDKTLHEAFVTLLVP
jgi:hypothetical protein